MLKEARTIGFACMLGAFVGGLIALELAENFSFGKYFWFVGALIGGFVAYVAVDFRDFCTGTVRSYHKTIAWQPDLLFWKACTVMAAGIAVFVSSISVIAIGVLITPQLLIREDTVAVIKEGFNLMAFLTCGGAVFGMLVANGGISQEQKKGNSNPYCTILNEGWDMILYHNLASLAWFALRRIPSAISVITRRAH